MSPVYRRGAPWDAGAGAGSAAVEDEMLAPLRDMLEPEAFRELLTLYEDTIRNTVAALGAAAVAGDLAALGGAAHDLAGLCGQIGSDRATRLARQIEDACEAGRGPAAVALAAEVGAASVETLAALAAYHDVPAEVS
jgi:HPt (histidine-containing phosphotransfer) domain-containing protein